MSAADFLTSAELKDLTAYSLKSKQAEWLKRHGWIFFLGGDGRARVAREHYAVKMGFRPAPEAIPATRAYGINVDALRGLAR
jgi:hypothetical protein